MTTVATNCQNVRFIRRGYRQPPALAKGLSETTCQMRKITHLSPRLCLQSRDLTRSFVFGDYVGGVQQEPGHPARAGASSSSPAGAYTETHRSTVHILAPLDDHLGVNRRTQLSGGLRQRLHWGDGRLVRSRVNPRRNGVTHANEGPIQAWVLRANLKCIAHPINYSFVRVDRRNLAFARKCCGEH